MTNNHCDLCLSEDIENNLIRWNTRSICTSCFQAMMRLKWSNNSMMIQRDGIVALTLHLTLLMVLMILFDIPILVLMIYEILLLVMLFVHEKNKLPNHLKESNARHLMWLSFAGAPWILSLWISRAYEFFRFRKVMNQNVLLSNEKVAESFYSSYQTTIAKKFLYTSVLEYIDIEFQGKALSVRTYGTVVYENELYGVFIPTTENTLYIVRIDCKEEVLHVAPKPVYDTLFDVFQQK